jgi:tetratricopeptide (TPR) repeat protein
MRTHVSSRFPRALWLASILALPACTRRPPETIARVVGASERRGPWVPPSGYEFFVRAELHAEQGEFQAAVESYEMARSGIDDPYVLAREADAALRIPNLALAASLIEEGLRATPDSEALLLVRARLAATNNDPALEEASLREAHRVAPESTESLFAWVAFLEAHERTPEAISLLDQFVTGHPLEGESPLTRARVVSVLRAELERAVLRHDVARGARVARQLVSLSPVHRPEILRFVAQAAANHEPLLAHAVMRALPIEASELPLRFDLALAANDRASAEGIALTFEDGTAPGALAAARCWLALGDGARAEEAANGVWLTTHEPEAQHLILRARIAQGHLHEAIALLDESRSPEARSALCAVLTEAALPALAREVCPSSPALETH